MIESDLTHNIQVIAEGHGLYIDKYNDMRKAVDKVRTTQELMEIRLTMMEGDVRALKARGKAEPVCRT